MFRSIALAAMVASLVGCHVVAACLSCGAALAQDAAADPASPSAPPPNQAALGPGSDPPPVAADPAPAAEASAAPSPAASPAAPKPGSMVLRVGDVVAGRSAEGKVRIMKVVHITFVEGDRLLHAMAYKETFHSWDEAQAAHDAHKLTVMLTHLPIDGEGLTPDANHVLANEPVTPKELEGYQQYLRDIGPGPRPSPKK